MFDDGLRVANLCWDGESFAPPPSSAAVPRLEGQFALAFEEDGRAVLARDRYGSNKLFFAIRDRSLSTASFISDLLAKGFTLDDVYSVPPGHTVGFDGASLSCERWFELTEPAASTSVGIGAIARDIRGALDRTFTRLGETFRDREVAVCLSGGLDSSLIAALATRVFPKVRAYSYSLGGVSEDASYAERMAAHLGVPFHFVPATPDDIFGALDVALAYGQDWRDFNVHCAIVNELLAREIRRTSGEGALVLTGDLMNEILADYTPIEHRGRTYYALPKLDPGALRMVLIKGLDAGDREIGVFARHGLDCLRPYCLVLDRYLQLPGPFLGEERAKQRLVAEIAGDLLPSFIMGRTKVRAQIGSDAPSSGILPLFVDSGRDSKWLRDAWRRVMNVGEDRALDRFLRAGSYRSAGAHPLARTRSS